ncbi:MAG: AraC family transcriptional regulator [Thermoanaerobaculia bacterium]
MAIPATVASRFAVGVLVEPLLATEIFRIGRWRCVVGPSESTATQTQKWYMISFTHRGAFLVHSGSRSAVIDANSTLLIKPGVPYRMSRHIGPRSRGAYVLVRSDVFQEIARESKSRIESEGDGFSEIRGQSSAKSYLLQRLILERAFAIPRPEPLEIEELGIALVSSATGAPEWAAERFGNSPSPTEPLELVERIRIFLAERFAQPLRLDEIAAAVRMSPFHLCRIFKRATGFTLHRYQISLRLRTALDRVADSSADLGELALRLGYSSHSHFTAAFRKEFGASPSEIRRGLPRERAREWPASLVPRSPAAGGGERFGRP